MKIMFSINKGLLSQNNYLLVVMYIGYEIVCLSVKRRVNELITNELSEQIL